MEHDLGMALLGAYLPEHTTAKIFGYNIVGLQLRDVRSIIRYQLLRRRVVRITRNVSNVLIHLSVRVSTFTSD